jgi:hypothetical protein
VALVSGSNITPTATVRSDGQSAATNWRLVPLRVRLAVNGGALQRVFQGVIIEREDDGRHLVYQVAGANEILRRSTVRTRLRYRRPIATATSPVGNDDPDINPAVGLFNELCWRAGGRPGDQEGSYPNAAFYYRAEGSHVIVEYGWFDGENGWESAIELARAGMGQVYIDTLGDVRFVSPLTLGVSAGGTPFLFDESVYSRLTVRESVAQAVSAVTCSFVKRAVQVRQEIYKDTTPRVLDPSASIDLTCAITLPIWRYGGATIKATDFNGTSAACTLAALGEYAQQFEFRITNTSTTLPAIIHEIAITGEPLVKIADGVMTYNGATFGPTPSSLRIPDSIYVQTEDDAARLARMTYDFVGRPRPIYTATRCAFSPDRTIGETVRLTCTRRSITNRTCRILNLRITGSGRTMDVDLLDISGIPNRDQLFVYGRTYATSDVRQVGY